MTTGPFFKTFDDLLDQVLTDYSNLDTSPNTGVGSIVYIKAAVLSSALWGIYKYLDWLSRQIFVDSASTDNLNHYGSIFGISRIKADGSSMSDTEYSTTILAAIRKPPAGGTRLDYQRWALATPAVYANTTENFLPAAVSTMLSAISLSTAWLSGEAITFVSTGSLPAPLVAGMTYYALNPGSGTVIQVGAAPGDSVPITLTTQGTGLHAIAPAASNLTYTVKSATVLTPPLVGVPVGTVTIVVLPEDSNGTEIDAYSNPIAGGTVVAAVADYVNKYRPVTAAGNTVTLVALTPVAVQLQVTPITAPVTTIVSDITNYMNSLNPGGPLYTSHLEAVAINAGAIGAKCILPTTDYYPTIGLVVRPGSIQVTPVSSF